MRIRCWWLTDHRRFLNRIRWFHTTILLIYVRLEMKARRKVNRYESIENSLPLSISYHCRRSGHFYIISIFRFDSASIVRKKCDENRIERKKRTIGLYKTVFISLQLNAESLELTSGEERTNEKHPLKLLFFLKSFFILHRCYDQ